MLQIRPPRVVHFAPEQVVHIAPDLLVHFSPESLVHFTADYSLWETQFNEVNSPVYQKRLSGLSVRQPKSTFARRNGTAS